MKFPALSAIVLAMLAATAAQSDQRTQLLKSGSWTLYRADNFQIEAMPEYLLSETCVLETGDAETYVRFILLPHEMTVTEPQFDGVIIIEVHSLAWDFPPRSGDLNILTESTQLIIPESQYVDDIIFTNFNPRTANGDMTQRTLLDASGNMSIADFRGRTILRFSSSGLSRTYSGLRDCAGF